MQYENLEGQEPKWKAGCVLAVLAFGVIGFISLIVLVAVEINSRPVPPPLLSQLQAGFANVKLGTVGFEKDIGVSGGIPAGLSGTVFRNTPQYYQGDNPHWFSGLAAVHSFALNNVTNTMTYKSQYVKSSDYLRALNASSPAFNSPNTVVTLWPIASHWLTSTAWTNQNEFDPVTLDTVAAPFKYDGDGKADDHLQPEHPHFTTSGDQYNFYADFQAGAYRLFTVPAGTTRRSLVNPNALIPFRQTPGGQNPLYQHSFLLTKQYLIMIEQPVEVGGGQFDKYTWHPDWQTSFRVISLQTGNEVKSFTYKGLFFFHASNAYECDGNSTINVDILQYPDASIMPNLFLSVMLNGSTNYKTAQSISSCRLWRYQLDMSQATGSPVSAAWQISDANIELPQIHHDRYTGQPYTYVYGAGIQGSSVFFNSLVKINVNTGASQSWSQSRAFPSEPLFVPNTAIANPKEDDGWLLSVVLDGKSQTSFLLVLNANDMSEACRATLSTVVPFGFHGHFMR